MPIVCAFLVGCYPVPPFKHERGRTKSVAPRSIRVPVDIYYENFLQPTS